MKQLVQERRGISEVIRQLYHDHVKKGTSATLSETVRALKSELQTYGRVYIVIDTLDECPQNQRTRETVLEHLQSLLESLGTVNLMITARPNTAIDEIRDMKLLEIRAGD